MLIKFNKQMMQIVNEALVRMPYAQAAPVINEINRQIQAIQESEQQRRLDMEEDDAISADKSQGESMAATAEFCERADNAAGE